MAKIKIDRLPKNFIALFISFFSLSVHFYISNVVTGFSEIGLSIFIVSTSSTFFVQTALFAIAFSKVDNFRLLQNALIVTTLLLVLLTVILIKNQVSGIATSALIFLAIVLWVISLVTTYKSLKLLVLFYKRLGSAFQRIYTKNKSLLATIQSLRNELEEQDADLSYSLGERNLELEIALRELSERNQELERLSAIDSLTGLMNRRYFDKRMLAETRRSKREQTPVGVALLDIDHFKQINDTYGHLCGDHCLKEFSKILKDEIKRPSDTISRYGGEEFVLILPNTDEDGLWQLLERIRTRLEKTVIYYKVDQFSMSVSIGGCSRVVQEDSENISLIGHVDRLLYDAKETGRNKTIIKPFK